MYEDLDAAITSALHDRDPERVIPQRYLRTDAQHASFLITTVDGRMKWTTCGQMLKALSGFLNSWEYVGLRFEVVVEGVTVGDGVLEGR